MTDGKFRPDSTLSRYEFAEAFVKIFYEYDPELKTSFPDVPKDSEYYHYVASGEAIDVIKGYEDGTFKGNNDVLKEEVIALCSRILKEQKGYSEPENNSDYLHFDDNDSLSDWSLGEIALAVREALIEDGGTLAPLSAISRRESALILYRLYMLLYDTQTDAALFGFSKTDMKIVIPVVIAIFVLVAVLGVLCVILIKRKKNR